MTTENHHPFAFTNRLSGETSPYLLQHAHNPVDWYPWGEAALARAQQEDKPILLSIGYSACHWCHVMERESFENTAIARLMNDHFVCIKVDREERADLDQIYMNSVQMMTGQGGWPLTVFLTPDGLPFYGGTYFPPEDRHGQTGFPRLLLALHEAYQNRRDQVLQSARQLTEQLESLNRFQASHEILTAGMLEQAGEATMQRIDWSNGGFAGAPKFPNTTSLELLLRTFRQQGNRAALEAVELTLQKMANGGIYDHLGGGFHRYTVDAQWLVPHFEKMLYDNALLSEIYLRAYQVTGHTFYRRIVEETLNYVCREMTSRDGGFYSSQDADSNGEEGRFFLWTLGEIESLLGVADGKAFCLYYGITEIGNFDERNILHVPRPLADVAAALGEASNRLEERLARGRQILFAAREQRAKPGRDEKILTAWNGLMLKSFAEAARVLQNDSLREVAIRNAVFLLSRMTQNGRLQRAFKDGISKFNGYLEDYAYFIDGLLSLYGATFDVRWLVEARRLTDVMVEQFWDDADSGFYFTAKDHEKLISRPKEIYDGAIPSATAVAADVLLRLSGFLEEPAYERQAVQIFHGLCEPATRHPMAFSRLLCALDFHLGPRRTVALVGDKTHTATVAFLHEINRRYLPNTLVALKEPADTAAEATVPWLRERGQVNGQPAAYVCENFTCHAPVTNVTDMAAYLQK
ncbi:MAG: thioredoxin domain-containing protein [Acidobacteria bacterium]|nr:thioredoxin domain-containing protein [Acidobacteriota bacterium]MBI3655659.1 thioredoxin domain-containing protein [Acidobacteriota bacterium]